MIKTEIRLREALERLGGCAKQGVGAKVKIWSDPGRSVGANTRFAHSDPDKVKDPPLLGEG